MTPTNKLRFVERSAPYYPGSQGGTVKTILQQWWEADKNNVPHSMHELIAKGEWRDVPVEKQA
jgi:hypothetical protein